MDRLDFPVFSDVNGALAVFEGTGSVPFNIKRVFAVTADKGDMRGMHAHYRCTQLLVSLSGAIKVTSFDGKIKEEIILAQFGDAVLIPPGIWATQEYLQDNTVMMVLCDRGYEPADYIRDIEVYKQYRMGKI